MTPSFIYAHFLQDDGWKPTDDLIRANSYDVTQVNPVIGDPVLKVPSRVQRIESARRLTATDRLPSPLFSGATQHLQYTDQVQREELLKMGVAEQPSSSQTVAVMIPIRKSRAWWDLAQDQRIAFYQKSGDHAGHTAIGLPYVSHIFRRLYHCRYLESAGVFDFITYFEFQREHTAEFLHLLESLRNVNKNPEWTYVEAEVEIWATKIV